MFRNIYTLTDTLLDSTTFDPFCIQNCLHGIDKIAPCQLLQICQLHIYDLHLLFHHIPNEPWRPFWYSACWTCSATIFRLPVAFKWCSAGNRDPNVCTTSSSMMIPGWINVFLLFMTNSDPTIQMSKRKKSSDQTFFQPSVAHFFSFIYFQFS